MKMGKFSDKETFLKHCEQQISNGLVYLYKRMVIPEKRLLFLNKFQSFWWEVKAKAKLNRTFVEGLWSKTLYSCLRGFKTMVQEEYNVADDCETKHYRVMQCVLRNRKRWLRHREAPIWTFETFYLSYRLYCKVLCHMSYNILMSIWCSKINCKTIKFFYKYEGK
jgi:hypothetical protein